MLASASWFTIWQKMQDLASLTRATDTVLEDKRYKNSFYHVAYLGRVSLDGLHSEDQNTGHLTQRA